MQDIKLTVDGTRSSNRLGIKLAVVVVCCLLLQFVSTSTGFQGERYNRNLQPSFLNYRRPQSSDYGEPLIDVVRRDWCARWGDYCIPKSRLRFGSCCGDLRCVCGTLFWKPGQCQCRKPSVFG